MLHKLSTFLVLWFFPPSPFALPDPTPGFYSIEPWMASNSQILLPLPPECLKACTTIRGNLPPLLKPTRRHPQLSLALGLSAFHPVSISVTSSLFFCHCGTPTPHPRLLLFISPFLPPFPLFTPMLYVVKSYCQISDSDSSVRTPIQSKCTFQVIS